jgi:heme-degrading monooxygenase HmoA
MDAIQYWKNDVEHQDARAKGKLDWYQDYQLQIAKVEHGYRWIKN